MKEYKVMKIDNLLDFNLDNIVKQSKEEDFRFVERLLEDYKSGKNTFNRLGEVLIGVFNEKGEIIAIGGVNQDPFTNDTNVGRVRRFYVCKKFRRKGIGSVLLKSLIHNVKQHYKVLVLHTDTEQGAHFYSMFGFLESSDYPNSTHYLELN